MKHINLAPIKQILSHSPFNSSQLREAIYKIFIEHGPQTAYNILLRIEAALKLRKPSLAIYDHTGHIIGGGQKYGFTVAHALKDMFDITLLLNKEISHQDIRDWYHLDLTSCQIKVIKIPFFEPFAAPVPDPARVSRRMENPFHIISKESGNYDFFINNSMNEMVYPLANVSALICHFPERRPKSYFYADHYTHVIYNSQYTAHWIEQKWKFSPHKHIYPPVDMAPAADTAKENIILSVARFEIGGSKKQLEMVKTFLKLNRLYPTIGNEWKLVLIGGSSGNPDENQYLIKIKELIEKSENGNIHLMINSSGDELKDLYGKAKIFWHLCGLDQTDPSLVEHFGMTIVEAMQNQLAPIVFDGGGQREIVDHGVNGFRIQSTAQLMSYTLKLIKEPKLRDELGRQALKKSFLFSRETFEKNVRDFFCAELEKYYLI